MQNNMDGRPALSSLPVNFDPQSMLACLQALVQGGILKPEQVSQVLNAGPQSRNVHESGEQGMSQGNERRDAGAKNPKAKNQVPRASAAVPSANRKKGALQSGQKRGVQPPEANGNAHQGPPSASQVQDETTSRMSAPHRRAAKKLLRDLVKDLDPVRNTYTEVPILTRSRVIQEFLDVYPDMYSQKELEEKMSEMMVNRRSYVNMAPDKKRDKIAKARKKVEDRRKARGASGKKDPRRTVSTASLSKGANAEQPAGAQTRKDDVGGERGRSSTKAPGVKRSHGVSEAEGETSSGVNANEHLWTSSSNDTETTENDDLQKASESADDDEVMDDVMKDPPPPARETIPRRAKDAAREPTKQAALSDLSKNPDPITNEKPPEAEVRGEERPSNQAPANNIAPSSNQAPANNIAPSNNQAPANNITPSSNQAPANNSTPFSNQAPANNSTPSSNQAPADNITPSSNQAPANNITPSSNQAPANNITPPNLETTGDLAIEKNTQMGVAPAGADQRHEIPANDLSKRAAESTAGKDRKPAPVAVERRVREVRLTAGKNHQLDSLYDTQTTSVRKGREGSTKSEKRKTAPPHKLPKVQLKIGDLIIASGLVAHDQPTDLIDGEMLGQASFGILVESLEADAAQMAVPEGFTNFQTKSGVLKVGDLPLKKVIDWPRDEVVHVETSRPLIQVPPEPRAHQNNPSSSSGFPPSVPLPASKVSPPGATSLGSKLKEFKITFDTLRRGVELLRGVQECPTSMVRRQHFYDCALGECLYEAGYFCSGFKNAKEYSTVWTLLSFASETMFGADGTKLIKETQPPEEDEEELG